MVRIDRVCIDEGVLDKVIARVRTENQKGLFVNGIVFAVNFLVFCFWVYRIVVWDCQWLAVCAALVMGFTAGGYWNRLLPSVKLQFLGVDEVVRDLYDSDLALLESGKNCALLQNGLVDFGNRAENECMAEQELEEYSCYHLNLFELDLSDLPEQSSSVLIVVLVLEESDVTTLTLKAVVVGEEAPL